MTIPIVKRSLGPAAAAVAALGFVACSSSKSTSGTLGSGDDGGGLDSSTSDDSSADGAGPGEDGAQGGGDGSSGDGGHLDGASTDAIASGDDGGNVGDGGGDGSYVPPPSSTVCSQTATWATGALLPISTPADDVLDGITPDELTIVWTEGAGSGATIQYADRATNTDPFGAPQSLPAGQYTGDRVAISPNGLRLIVVNADAQGFSELTRTARMSTGNTFGGAATGSYTNLDMAGVLSAGESYGDPVVSADDTVFYYSIYGGSSSVTIHRSARLLPTDTWPIGAPLASSTGLAAQGSLRRRPTFVSSDRETLFVWDQVTGTERAAWINQTTGAFDTFVDMGARSMASADTTCSRLYYSAQGPTGSDGGAGGSGPGDSGADGGASDAGPADAAAGSVDLYMATH